MNECSKNALIAQTGIDITQMNQPGLSAVLVMFADSLDMSRRIHVNP